MTRFTLPWKIHGNGKNVSSGAVVAPEERLSRPRTFGIGVQHIVAMFGATFLVPLLTGLPPATTLFFSGVGTILFLVITAGKVPSYLGSSFAFIAPIAAVQAGQGTAVALGGVVVAGAALFLVGLLVQWLGSAWINRLMPPAVVGTVVALIGFNLAPAAKNNVTAAPLTALVTIVAIVIAAVIFRGILGRLSILLGVVVGYLTAASQNEVDFSSVSAAPWIGLPHFQAPAFNWSIIGLFVPVVLVLIAENIGHVKSVASMLNRDLNPLAGRALMADGLATVLAGGGGGSGTTTYAENIGVMAATRVYSTAAYWIAALGALTLSFSPKFGALIATIPPGVLGGAGTVLYGMIGVLGARIWVQNKVDFGNPINLTTAAIALIIGIADYTWTIGEMSFAGIALGTAAALGVYHGMHAISRLRGRLSRIQAAETES